MQTASTLSCLRVGRTFVSSSQNQSLTVSPTRFWRALPQITPHIRLSQSSQALRCFSSTSSLPGWPLDTLPDVSKGTSPLIFHSTSTNPYYNLSLEHFLLTNSQPTSRILLFYTNRPCVVLGRNQNPWLECDLLRLQEGLPATEEEGTHQNITAGKVRKSQASGSSHRDVDGVATKNVPIDVVRRRSGGGTVFHDAGNLNYSVIVPNDKDFERRKHAEMVVRGLSSLRVSRFNGVEEIKVNERNDIVMKRHGAPEWLKISGSAFKLTRGRALHHGTLLFSSPNLGRISGFLKSPGRDFIHAKGVESVRSKVGNLSFIIDLEEREELKNTITHTVANEFWKMYGQPHTRSTDIEETIGDEDCEGAQANAQVARGIAELLSDEWRFGQTPKFDFDSGVTEGVQVKFQSNHGIVDEVFLHSGPALKQTAAKIAEVHLEAVDDWKHLFETTKIVGDADGVDPEPSSAEGQTPSVSPAALIQRVASIFPHCASGSGHDRN